MKEDKRQAWAELSQTQHQILANWTNVCIHILNFDSIIKHQLTLFYIVKLNSELADPTQLQLVGVGVDFVFSLSQEEQ